VVVSASFTLHWAENITTIWQDAVERGFATLSEGDWERLGIETPVKLVSQIAEEVRQAEFQGLEEARPHMDAVLEEALRPLWQRIDSLGYPISNWKFFCNS
jgi:hypothetical protein